VRAVYFRRLGRGDIVAAAGGLLLFISMFLPWYGVKAGPPANENVCGAGKDSCTGFDTFPILRWLLLAGALAPLILAWILVRGHRLSWAPGELTMIVGFIAMVLIGYNGLIDKPGNGPQEIGVSLDYGYWLALLGSIAIAATGFLRSQVGQKRERKAPGTV